ncbi:hypothetical protein ACFCV3_41620 [Kribbella sp. NPDC056345]|uniref:hypothetical protein n=1 Tax=Kribbella sp. NPDC056345 TaxID=3345789 RepID=UPI0035DABC7E
MTMRSEAGSELVGGHDAAVRLKNRTGLEVRRWDVEVLVDDGVLAFHSVYENTPLYRVEAVDAVAVAQLAPIVQRRLDWFADSVYIPNLPEYLGVSWARCLELLQEHAPRTGLYRRIAKADLEPLRRHAALIRTEPHST